jgi:hypothetical protein
MKTTLVGTLLLALAFLLSGCGSSGGRLNLVDRNKFLSRAIEPGMMLELATYEDYSQADYDAELDHWCATTRWNDSFESKRVFWLTVRINCGEDRADELSADAGFSTSQTSEWAREFNAQLKILNIRS